MLLIIISKENNFSRINWTQTDLVIYINKKWWWDYLNRIQHKCSKMMKIIRWTLKSRQFLVKRESKNERLDMCMTECKNGEDSMRLECHPKVESFKKLISMSLRAWLAYPARLSMTISNTFAKLNNSISTSKRDQKRKSEYWETS